jgi:hypothetical protein
VPAVPGVVPTLSLLNAPRQGKRGNFSSISKEVEFRWPDRKRR